MRRFLNHIVVFEARREGGLFSGTERAHDKKCNFIVIVLLRVRVK
jgi:hypothetical protein